jgi:hypothetical protein
LHRRVIEADDILSELYADNFDVSDEECKSESVNSDVATTTAGREW